MHQRFQVSGGLLLVLLAVGPLAQGPVAGQTRSAAQGRTAKPTTPARTPDGQPDLQGFWTNSTYTPLERPDNVTKEIYTPEEFAATVKQAAERERVRGHHPLAARRREAKRLLRRGQRDVDDRRIEHDHQLRDTDHREHRPAPRGFRLAAFRGHALSIPHLRG